MPKPMALCIENLDPQSGAPKYVRCVALPGRQPGLRLAFGGAVLWQSDDAIACELWVSGDDRLILYRPEGATAVVLRRAGRGLDVPYDKPVVVIDQDEIDVGTRRLRVHVHGDAPAVAAPSEYVPEQGALGRLVRAAAAAVAIASAVATGGCIEVRDKPPKPAPPPKPPHEKKIDVRDESPKGKTRLDVPDDRPRSKKPSADSDAPADAGTHRGSTEPAP